MYNIQLIKFYPNVNVYFLSPDRLSDGDKSSLKSYSVGVSVSLLLLLNPMTFLFSCLYLIAFEKWGFEDPTGNSNSYILI